jgi:hypothetical protein
MNNVTENLVAIKPLAVINVLKKLDRVSLSHAYKNSQRGVSPKRRIPRTYTSSTGWTCESVDRNGQRAVTINGHVWTPAEAVRLSYRTNGYNYQSDLEIAQTPIVLDALKSAGFTVTEMGNGYFLVKKEAN